MKTLLHFLSKIKMLAYQKALLLFSFLSSFYLEAEKFIGLITGFVLLDAFIAIAVAIRLGGREAYQSQRLKDTPVKWAIYMFVLLMAYGVEMVFKVPLALKGVAVFLGYTESKSIDEKYYKWKGKHLLKGLIDMLPNMNKNK
jgi:hypothetical protein